MSETTGGQPGAGAADPAPLPAPAAVAGHLEALNLAGLAFAAKRLLGKDPMPVAGQFTMWARAGQQGLPALTDAMWEALSPLRIGRPASPAAALCDQVLVGAERDGAVGRRATVDCANAGKAQFKQRPLDLPDGDSRADALRQKALVNAVKDYWRGLAGVYTEARQHVVSGDLSSAVQTLRGGEVRLRDLVEQVSVLAAGVASAGGAVAAPVEPTPVERPEAAPEPVVEPQPEPQSEPAPVDVLSTGTATGPLVLTDEQAEAFARQQPLRVQEELEAEPEPRPVEVLSTKPVRNHPFLPIIFLLVVSAVAMYVLYAVLNDPTNPLQ